MARLVRAFAGAALALQQRQRAQLLRHAGWQQAWSIPRACGTAATGGRPLREEDFSDLSDDYSEAGRDIGAVSDSDAALPFVMQRVTDEEAGVTATFDDRAKDRRKRVAAAQVEHAVTRLEETKRLEEQLAEEAAEEEAVAEEEMDMFVALQQMVRDGAQPAADTFHAVMAQSMHGDRVYRVFHLRSMMQAAQVPPTTRTYDLLLSACATLGDVERAQGLVEEMRAAGLRVSAPQYHRVLAACGPGGQWREALGVLDAMRERGVPLAPETLTSAMLLCAHAGQLAPVMQLFKQMRDAGMAVPRPVYDAALTVCAGAGRVDQARLLLARMQTDGYIPDERHHSLAVLACLKAEDFAGTLHQFVQLQKALPQQALQARTYTLPITAATVVGQRALALALLRDMVTSAHFENDDPAPLNEVMAQLVSVGEAEAVLHAFRAMEKRSLKPDAFSYQSAVCAAMALNQPELASQLCVEMTERGVDLEPVIAVWEERYGRKWSPEASEEVERGELQPRQGEGGEEVESTEEKER